MKFSGPFVVLILAALFYATSAVEAEEKSKLSKVQPRGLIGSGRSGSGESEGISSFLKICKNESAVSDNPMLCIMCKGPSAECFKSLTGGAGGFSRGSSGGSATSPASATVTSSAS